MEIVPQCFELYKILIIRLSYTTTSESGASVIQKWSEIITWNYNHTTAVSNLFLKSKTFTRKTDVWFILKCFGIMHLECPENILILIVIIILIIIIT